MLIKLLAFVLIFFGVMTFGYAAFWAGMHQILPVWVGPASGGFI